MDLFYFEPRTAEVCRFFGFGDTLEMVGIPRFTRDTKELSWINKGYRDKEGTPGIKKVSHQDLVN